jgi:hypothetical protein
MVLTALRIFVGVLLCGWGIWRFATGLPEEWRIYSLLLLVGIGDVLIEWPFFKRDFFRPRRIFGGPTTSWPVRVAMIAEFAVTQVVILALIVPQFWPEFFQGAGAVYYVPLLTWLLASAVLHRVIGYRQNKVTERQQ